jgi:hypothetical protein
MGVGSRTTGATDAALTIIAEALCATDSPYCVESMKDEDAKDVLDLLTARGYRIIGPDDITVIRQMCTELKSRGNLLYVSPDEVDRLAALIGDGNA